MNIPIEQFLAEMKVCPRMTKRSVIVDMVANGLFDSEIAFWQAMIAKYMRWHLGPTKFKKHVGLKIDLMTGEDIFDGLLEGIEAQFIPPKVFFDFVETVVANGWEPDSEPQE